MRTESKTLTTTAPLKDCANQSCFIAPVSSHERVKAAKGVIPANTRANSNWAIKNFKEWASIGQQWRPMILYLRI